MAGDLDDVGVAEEAADIADVEPGPMFRENPHRELGERLRELLHDVEERGYRGDRLVTDSWAEKLGLRKWYEWKRLGEVTPVVFVGGSGGPLWIFVV